MSAIARTHSIFLVISLAALAIPAFSEAARKMPAKNLMDLTGQDIETAFKKLAKDDQSEAQHIDDLRNLLDLDSALVEYDPITQKTTIKIRTKNRQNINQRQKELLEQAVKYVLESIWEEEVKRTDEEHQKLMEGITVKMGPHFIGPRPILPTAIVTPSTTNKGAKLRVDVTLNRPALMDSSIEFEISDGTSTRKFKVSIPKDAVSGMAVQNMQALVQLVGTKLPKSQTYGRLTITKVVGVAKPAFGEGSWIIGQRNPDSTLKPGERDTKTDNVAKVDSCPICEPVYSCPTCSRRFGRR